MSSGRQSTHAAASSKAVSRVLLTMRNPSFFAGEAEILALSDALKLPISVVLETGLGTLKSIATVRGEVQEESDGQSYPGAV